MNKDLLSTSAWIHTPPLCKVSWSVCGSPGITPVDHSITDNHHPELPVLVARLINQVCCHRVSSHSSHQKALSSLGIHVTFTVRGCQHQEILPGPRSSSQSNEIYPQSCSQLQLWITVTDWGALQLSGNREAAARATSPNTFVFLFSSLFLFYKCFKRGFRHVIN